MNNCLIKITLLFSSIIWTLTSCTNNDDEISSNFIYIPIEIKTTNGGIVTITQYTYDTNFRIIGITDTIRNQISVNGINVLFRDSTYSALTYDEAGRIVRMDIERGFNIRSNEKIPVAIISHDFTYAAGEDGNTLVTMVSRNYTEKLDSTYILTINSNDQLIRYENNLTGRFTEYLYDKNGNLIQTTAENGKEFYFSSDSKKGLYSEVNMYDWIVMVMLGLQRNTYPVDIYLNNNYLHNNETVYARDLSNMNNDNRVIYREFTNAYNSFGYLVGFTESYTSSSISVIYRRKF